MGSNMSKKLPAKIQEIMTARPTVLNKPAIEGPIDRPKDDQIVP